MHKKRRNGARSDSSSLVSADTSAESSSSSSSSSSSQDAATTVGILQQGEMPSNEQVTALGASIGNSNVATLVTQDTNLTRGIVAQDETPATKPRKERVLVDDDQSSTSSVDGKTATTETARSARKAPRKGKRDAALTATPSIQPAQNPMTEVMGAWMAASSVIASLKKTGADVFADAANGASDKQRAKLDRKRREFDDAADELQQTVNADVRDASRLDADLHQLDPSTLSPEREGQIASYRAAIVSLLTALLRSLMDGAKMAYTHGDAARAAEFTRLANDVHSAGGLLDRGDGATRKAGTNHKGNLAFATTVMDTANNVGPGVVGGTIGGVEAATQPILTGVTAGAASISSGASGVFGGLGVVFGSIGVALGVKASIRGASSEKELKALRPSLVNDELGDAAAYAAEKKRKKKWGGGATAVMGGLAIAAGVVGLVALSVATLGIGAAVLGIGAALIGLGFLVGKYIHKRHKRAKYAKALAEGLVNAAMDNTDASSQAQALAQLQGHGLDEADLSDPVEREAAIRQLSTIYEKDDRNRRQDTARVIYQALIGDDVSDQIDAERIVEALHLKVAKIRTLQESDAVAKITDKMASW